MFQESLQTRNIVPFRYLPDGIYLLKQHSSFLVIEHYGVLITGKFLREFGIYNSEPIVIHLTYPYLRWDWAMNTGSWSLLGQVHSQFVPLALERLRVALQSPSYNLLTNNCEQFARFVTEGEKYSTQVRMGVFLLGIALLANQNNN